MTARGGLHAVTASEAEAARLARRGRPRQLAGDAWFRIRDTVSGWSWAVLAAVIERIATMAVRERAWTAGFGMALGTSRGPRWLSVLLEYADGNEAAWELRAARGDYGHVPREQAVIAQAARILLAEAGVTVPPAAARPPGGCQPFALPAHVPLSAAEGRPAALVLAAARRSRARPGGRHATPAATTAQRAARPRHAAARHAGPARRRPVLGWLRRVLPGAAPAPGRHGAAPHGAAA